MSEENSSKSVRADIEEEQIYERFEKALNSIQNGQDVLTVQYRKPEYITQPMTKVTSYAFANNSIPPEVNNIRISSASAKNVFTVPTRIVAYNESGTAVSQTLGPYDELVFSGICSHIENQIYENNPYISFTARQVYEAVNGGSTNPSGSMEEIKASIQKMMATRVSLDITDHLRMYRREPSERVKICGYMAPLKEITLLSNRQETEGYVMSKEFLPPLYVYSREVNQMCKTSTKMLQVPGLQNTRTNSLIRYLLLKEISYMKKRKRWNRIITYDRIFRHCEMDAVNANYLTRRRKAIQKMLDFWKKESMIKDYTINKRGSQYYSIKFNV